LALDWELPFESVCNFSQPPFAGGSQAGESTYAITQWTAIYRNGVQAALHFFSSETNEKRVLTFGDLHREVNEMAAVLASRGVGKGDRVVIYLPMIPEAVVAMLACARLGAIHCVVFAGFAAQSLAERIRNTDRESSSPRMPDCAAASWCR